VDCQRVDSRREKCHDTSFLTCHETDSNIEDVAAP